MKRLLTLLLLFIPAFSLFATDYYYVKADVLNVRSQPSKSGSIVGVVKKGNIVTTESEAYNGWIKISTSTITGYVSTDYLRFSHSKNNSVPVKEKKASSSPIRLGFWGWTIVLVIISLICRGLRSIFEAVDWIAYLLPWAAFIIVWISEGFWAGLLYGIIGCIAISLLFGIGGGTQIRKFGRRYTLTCDKCGYEHLKITEETDLGVVTRCRRCGQVCYHMLNH